MYKVAAVGLLVLATAWGCSNPSSPSSSPSPDQASNPLLSRLTIQGSSGLVVGTTVQWSATAAFSDGSSKDVTGQVIWASSDDTVVRVSTAGLVNPVSAGDATLRASYFGKTSDAALSVAIASVPVTFTLTRPGANNPPLALWFAITGTRNVGCKPTQAAPAPSGWSVYPCTLSLPPGSYGINDEKMGPGTCVGFTASTGNDPAVPLTRSFPSPSSTTDACYAIFTIDSRGRVGG